MKKDEFKQIVAAMNEDRKAYSKLHLAHEPIREFLNEIKREYQSLNDADWFREKSKAALDDKVKKQTAQFLESYTPENVSQILEPYDVCSTRIDLGYKVVPIGAVSDRIGTYGLPGAVFLERLIEAQKNYAALKSLPVKQKETIIAGMINSFNYACKCKRDNNCESCKAAETLEALTQSIHTAQILLSHFYREKERTLRKEYPIVEWDKGVNANVKFNFAFLKDRPNDTLKLLCTQGRNLPALEHITYERHEGFVRTNADLKSEREVENLYTLLEAVKERKYSREDAQKFRTDLTALLELVHLREHLESISFSPALKYAKRGEQAISIGLADSLEQLMNKAKTALQDTKGQINLSKNQLREKYGVLTVAFCCETDKNHDGPSMFPHVPQGRIEFYGKTITSSNDMKLIKTARDYLILTST